ncbi:bacterial transferase hexapeptide repeat-containing protein [Wolffia australiana]
MPSIGAIRASPSISGCPTHRILWRLFFRGMISGNTDSSEGRHAVREEGLTVIHPTAVVHPDAVIGQGVSVGAFCTIGAAVRIGDHCQVFPGCHIFGHTELGENCTLLSGAIVGGNIPGSTIIGRNNTIGHNAVVGAKCQDLKYMKGDECFLHVGDDNDIRENASIHRSSSSMEKTIIGNNNLIMGACHIAHDCKVGNNNIFSNNSLFAGHVVVEDYVRTSGASVIHQFCRLGCLCFVSGGSAVSQDVPRYMMVSGNRAEIRGLNLEGLRRKGISSAEIMSMKRAYRKIFMPVAEQSAISIEQRIAEVEENEELSAFPAVLSMVESIRDSFQKSQRGICPFRSRSIS